MKTGLSFFYLLLAYLQQANVEGKESTAIIYTDKYADTEIERGYVPLDMHEWRTKYADYAPIEFTAPCPTDIECDPTVISPQQIHFNKMDNGVDRKSMNGKYDIDEYGKPLNPKGRTGISGRGILPRWGPNFCIFILALRNKMPYDMLSANSTEYSGLNVLGLPGEFVDNPNYIVIPPKMRASFAKNLAAQRLRAETMLITAEKKSQKIHSGFIPDERNTDNSWVEMILYQIEDDNFATTGLIDPKLTPEIGEMAWKMLDFNSVMINLERVVQRSKMSFSKNLKHKLILFKERHRRLPGKINAKIAFRLILMAIDTACMGVLISIVVSLG